MDAMERLKQADPGRSALAASRAKRAALAGRLAQQQQGDIAQSARRRSLVVPVAIAAALAISFIGFVQPSRATLAWSPTADASPLAPSADLKTVCTEGMPITAQQLDLLSEESLDLVDTRGNASLAVWSTPELRLHCMLLSDGSEKLVRGPAMLSEPLAQDSAQLNIEFMAGTEWMGEMVMVLSGQAPEGTTDVAVVGQESEDFSASVNSAGQFAVWWPSASGQITGRVVARDAELNELDSLELSTYYGDSGAQQTAPPADGIGVGTDSDPTSEMPGGNMLDFERPLPSDGVGDGTDSDPTSEMPDGGTRDPNDQLPPVTGGDGTFEPAQITNVRVPAEVQAGSPLVIRFRMTDTSGYQAPVAFVGGPSGWVSSWCGFGAAAIRLSGDQRDGEYEVSCLVPANAPSAEYIVQIGCECTFPESAGEPWSVRYSFDLVGGSSDVSAPVIASSRINWLGEVAAGSTFSVSTYATDENDIAYVVAWVDGPNGRTTNDAFQPWASDMGLDTIARNGGVGWEQFVQTITLRADATPGRYRIWFSVGDSIGNRAALYDVTLIEFVIE